jgi:predicted RNA-binding protein with EMAP domain
MVSFMWAYRLPSQLPTGEKKNRILIAQPAAQSLYRLSYSILDQKILSTEKLMKIKHKKNGLMKY